jgi:hypothetical protein
VVGDDDIAGLFDVALEFIDCPDNGQCFSFGGGLVLLRLGEKTASVLDGALFGRLPLE